MMQCSSIPHAEHHLQALPWRPRATAQPPPAASARAKTLTDAQRRKRTPAMNATYPLIDTVLAEKGSKVVGSRMHMLLRGQLEWPAPKPNCPCPPALRPPCSPNRLPCLPTAPPTQFLNRRMVHHKYNNPDSRAQATAKRGVATAATAPALITAAAPAAGGSAG